MPFKPLAHLARVSFAKGLAHGYAPPAIFAGQSSYATTTSTLGQFHNYPVYKFAKASHINNAFSGASSSSGAGAGSKAGSTTQSSGGDGGLAQYYAAWQHAQQTGDDSDWKKHQIARRIGWKSPAKAVVARHDQRLDSAPAADILRPPNLVAANRTCSDSAAQEFKQTGDSLAEEEALAQVDEAIAQEIRNVKEATSVDFELPETPELAAIEQRDTSSPTTYSIDSDNSVAFGSSAGSVDLISPATAESDLLSERITELGRQKKYVDIPALFEAILRDGLTPTVQAYNQILVSAITLGNGAYQVWPRALEIYSDMTRRSVEPNSETYGILIDFLAARGLQVLEIQRSLDVRGRRYGSADGSFPLTSTSLVHELYAGDKSIVFATKLYHVARAKLAAFSLSSNAYNALLEACIKVERIEDLKLILSDMKTNNVSVDMHLYPRLIEAYALVKDISAAQSCYEEYRDLAIVRSSNDSLDMQVYAALIKSYHLCDMANTGLRFYDKVRQSFTGAQDEQALTSSLDAAFVLKAIVPYHLQQRAFEQAVEAVRSRELQLATKDAALAKICIRAAEMDEASAAHLAYTALSGEINQDVAAMALAAMYIRLDRLAEAKAVLSANVVVSSVDFAIGLTVAMLKQGQISEGINAARRMFEQIRASAVDAGIRANAMDDIDEAIVQIGEALASQHVVLTSEMCISLLRTMIENGGLVSPVAQHAIASLGPDCVHELNSQDIALALHVQAGLLAKPSGISDIAHTARFSHLLETVLNRGSPMDPSTVNVISDALPQLKGSRPDLERRWLNLLRPTVVDPQSPSIVSPVLSTTSGPAIDHPTSDTFDPYAYNSDFRASKIIEDQLESTAGRLENHLSDALSRFRNVRRAGRHLTYRAYAKLITAAGKTKQPHLMQEILGMAQADVPLIHQYEAVRNGWIAILDAMVSACLTVGDRQLAAEFHQNLLDMGAAPSANTFGIYITTLEGTFDEATEAVKIFQRAISEGVEPSVFLYNAVIGKLGKARRIDDCLFYFGDMQSKNIRPSSVTYGTLVNALCRTSEERFAEEMFDEMESMPNYKPRAAPYNSIIQYFLNTKRDRSKVLSYYERMKTRGIKPTSHTYKLLIEAHASLEPINLPAAEAVLGEMKASGVLPEAVHYGTLIHARGCVMHDMAGARSTFDTVLADGVVRPNDNLYQNLLESMVANHQVAQTDDILSDMKRRSVEMTPYIANTLIHGWASEGDVDKAKSIYDGLGKGKREPSTYEAMTRAFLSGGRKEEAEAVVSECLRKGYPSAVAEKVLGLLGGGD